MYFRIFLASSSAIYHPSYFMPHAYCNPQPVMRDCRLLVFVAECAATAIYTYNLPCHPASLVTQ
jgi:hypothetical protein